MNLNLIFQGYQNLTIRVAIYRSDINCQNLILAHDGQIINTTLSEFLGSFFDLFPFSFGLWAPSPPCQQDIDAKVTCEVLND